MYGPFVDINVNGLSRAVEGNCRLSQQHSCSEIGDKRRHDGKGENSIQQVQALREDEAVHARR